MPPAATTNLVAAEELLVAGTFGGALIQANGTLDAGPFGTTAGSCIAMRTGPARLTCQTSHGEVLVGGDFEDIAAYTDGYGYPQTMGFWVEAKRKAAGGSGSGGVPPAQSAG